MSEIYKVKFISQKFSFSQIDELLFLQLKVTETREEHLPGIVS